MIKSVNMYDLKNISIEKQKEYLMCLVSYGVYKSDDKYIFDENLVSADNEAKMLLKFKPLVEKVEKLVEMVNVDNSLIDKDIETELWDML